MASQAVKKNTAISSQRRYLRLRQYAARMRNLKKISYFESRNHLLATNCAWANNRHTDPQLDNIWRRWFVSWLIFISGDLHFLFFSFLSFVYFLSFFLSFFFFSFFLSFSSLLQVREMSLRYREQRKSSLPTVSTACYVHSTFTQK